MCVQNCKFVEENSTLAELNCLFPFFPEISFLHGRVQYLEARCFALPPPPDVMPRDALSFVWGRSLPLHVGSRSYVQAIVYTCRRCCWEARRGCLPGGERFDPPGEMSFLWCPWQLLARLLRTCSVDAAHGHFCAAGSHN